MLTEIYVKIHSWTTKKERAKKLYDELTVGEPSYSGKKTGKEKIFCSGRDERYEKPITEDWAQ